jgi:hypothetical protein
MVPVRRDVEDGCPVTPRGGEGKASARAFQRESLPEWQRIHDRYAASLASA